MPTADANLLPHDIGSEEAVLGCILLAHSGEPEWVDPAFRLLKPTDFYRERNGWILTAVLSLRARGMAVDQVTVGFELRDTGRIDDVGGFAYLSYLISRVPTPYHAGHYAEIVKECAERRRAIQEAGDLAGRAYQGGDEWRRKRQRKPVSETYDDLRE